MADQNRAQKSEVHETSVDATSSPASNFERGAADADVKRNPEATDPDASGTVGSTDEIGGGPGAGDASSGGGAGSGIPGGGTDLRTNGAFSRGDVNKDREKLFPDKGQNARDAAPPGATIVSDESDDGGPVRIRTADANLKNEA